MNFNLLNPKKYNKQIAVLIDPDKQTLSETEKIAQAAQKADIDFILTGGSLVFENIEQTIIAVKKVCDKPVFLFPGNVIQLSDKADGIFLLSLISGRNPDYLIGNHVIAAPFLKKSEIKIIPVGYILIESGKTTSAEYMSNTKPVPYEKTDIATATAIAGQFLGNKIIYLEAGSGAEKHVSEKMIKSVKQNIQIPLIVGGGIKTEKHLTDVCNAGADIVVVGTAFEKNVELIKKFSQIVHSF